MIEKQNQSSEQELLSNMEVLRKELESMKENIDHSNGKTTRMLDDFMEELDKRVDKKQLNDIIVAGKPV